MHELAVTQSVVDAVVARFGNRRVTAVSLEIGRLSGFEPDALRFCFELVTAGTSLEGAALHIDRPPGLAHCLSCDAEFEVRTSVLLCDCGSADVRLRRGGELAIHSVAVA